MTQQAFSGWKDQLQALIDANNPLRYDGKIASDKTQEERAKILFKFFKDLWSLGFKIPPTNIKEKHIRAICAQYEQKGLAASTIQTYLSTLRLFCLWINKPGMIKDVSMYFSDKRILDRNYQAVSDKSWDVCGIDKERIFAEMELNYPFIWMQLLVMDAFGLRRKEAISLRPYLAEKDGHLYITAGSKGGKSRIIKIESEYQQLVMHKAIEFVGKKAIHLGGATPNLQKNLRKFSNVVHRLGIKKTGKGALGITAHGLRAGFAMRQMMLKGLVPYIKGGAIGGIDKVKEQEIRREVSMLLGHNRIQVTTAYSGPQTQKGVWLLDQYLAAQLSIAIQTLEVGQSYRFTLIDQINEKGVINSTIDVIRKFHHFEKEGELFMLVLADNKGMQEQLYVTVISRITKY